MKKPLILILLITLSLGFAEPIKVLTPFGTPMSGAEVEIRLLDGTTIKNVLDVNGEVAVRDVPLGIVFLRIVKWRGYPVDYNVTVTIHNTSVSCPKIGKLVVIVRAEVGGLLKPFVKISRNNISKEVYPINGEVVSIELPEGKYTVEINFASDKIIKEIVVEGKKTTIVEEVLPYIVLWGTPFRKDFLVMIVAMLIVTIFVVAILIIEIKSFLYARKIRKLTGIS